MQSWWELGTKCPRTPSACLGVMDVLFLAGKMHRCVSVGSRCHTSSHGWEFRGTGVPGWGRSPELFGSALSLCTVLHPGSGPWPHSVRDARRAETRGFQPFGVFSGTTSLPHCFSSLNDTCCLWGHSERRQPASGCTPGSICSPQMGRSRLVPAAGVGSDRDPSWCARGMAEHHKFFNNFLEREGETKKKPPCIKCHSLWTYCVAFIYFCISVGQLNHRLRVLTRKL